MRVRASATLAALALLSGSWIAGPASAQPAEYGKVDIAAAEPPARFAADWPASVTAIERWYEGAAALPMDHALDGLLAGDASLFERLTVASLAVAEQDQADWLRLLHNALAFRTIRPEFCTTARPAMEGAPSLLREVLAPSFVRQCLLPDDRALVLRADTPANAVIDYFAPRYSFADAPLPPWDDRLEGAVRAAYDAALNAYARRDAAFALIRHPDPRAEAAVLALYREAPEGDGKIELAMLLRGGKSAQARAIGQSVCNEHPNSEPCERERESREFRTRMRAEGVTVYDEFAPQPVDIPEPLDPPEKVRRARDQLIAAGFDRLREFDPASIGQAEPIAILGKAGYLHGFDLETSQFPNAHDTLMRELAALADDAFAGALFEEIPPVYDEDVPPGEEPGPYRLSVYLGGKRYRIDAENLEDWYDLHAVLTVMNAVLADRRASDRLFTLYNNGQTAVVIAATPDAFDKAVAAGLIQPHDFRDEVTADEAFGNVDHIAR